MSARCETCKGQLTLAKLKSGPDSYECHTCEPRMMLSYKQEYLAICEALGVHRLDKDAIVRAMNSRKALLDACKELTRSPRYPRDNNHVAYAAELAQAAIALAEAE